MEENKYINSIISIDKFSDELTSVNIDAELFLSAFNKTFNKSFKSYKDLIYNMKRIGLFFKIDDLEYVPITPPLMINNENEKYIPDLYFKHKEEFKRVLGYNYKTLLSNYYGEMKWSYYIVDPAEIEGLNFYGSNNIDSKYFYSSDNSEFLGKRVFVSGGEFIGLCSYKSDGCNLDINGCSSKVKLSFVTNSTDLNLNECRIENLDFGSNKSFGEIELYVSDSSISNIEIYGSSLQIINFIRAKCNKISSGSRVESIKFNAENSIFKLQKLSSTNKIDYRMVRSLVSNFDISSSRKQIYFEDSIVSSSMESRISGVMNSDNELSVYIINSKLFSSISLDSVNVYEFEVRNTRITRSFHVGMANFASRPIVDRVFHSAHYRGANDKNLQLLESFLDIIYDQQKKFNSTSGEINLLSMKFDLIRGYSSEFYGRFDKLINFLYFTLSNYGRSISKPLVVLSVVFASVFIVDVTVLGLSGVYVFNPSVRGVLDMFEILLYTLQDTPVLLLVNFDGVYIPFPDAYVMFRAPVRLLIGLISFFLIFLSFLAIRRRYQIN